MAVRLDRCSKDSSAMSPHSCRFFSTGVGFQTCDSLAPGVRSWYTPLMNLQMMVCWPMGVPFMLMKHDMNDLVELIVPYPTPVSNTSCRKDRHWLTVGSTVLILFVVACRLHFLAATSYCLYVDLDHAAASVSHIASGICMSSHICSIGEEAGGCSDLVMETV